MEKEMKITPPVGYEIDTENSTFDCIKFKPVKQELTYEDVCEKIFKEVDICYYITNDGCISTISTKDCSCDEANDAPTKAQLEKILAINQLQNIANYYNGDWKPDWEDKDETKYVIYFNNYYNHYNIIGYSISNYGYPVFKSREFVKAVIDNPNFREILDTIFKN